jgi:hypothetical protein
LSAGDFRRDPGLDARVAREVRPSRSLFVMNSFHQLSLGAVKNESSGMADLFDYGPIEAKFAAGGG